MKIALLNPPHTAIGSRIPREHLPPLGLLSIGGPLIDAGFDVVLIDADYAPLSLDEIHQQVHLHKPDIVMIGHSGSSSVHETVIQIATLLKAHLPDLKIIYGGVHPTYFWDEILRDCRAIDIIVRGEGELTATLLIKALHEDSPLENIRGIAYRAKDEIVCTPPAQMIEKLDDFRVGWELIDFAKYSYWGGKRAVVMQFSRGCPYQCSYCGQRGFWTTWRHRDPVRFAKEIDWLVRSHGVQLINLADELPTGSRKAWLAFLQALIELKTPVLLVGSTRTSDIVRDADILHLYKKAGVIRFLLGIESYDPLVLKTIRKGATMSVDAQAIKLLRKHDIVSMATYVLDFAVCRDKDCWNSYRHLLGYDPDQIQMLYAVPHRWTPFYSTVEDRKIIQPNTRRWDYKHQVLENPGLPPWRMFGWFKALEVLMQLRPRVLLRTLFHRDADYRHAMRWYTRIGRRVWLHEVAEFVFDSGQIKNGPTLREFQGPTLAHREYSMQKIKCSTNLPKQNTEQLQTTNVTLTHDGADLRIELSHS